MRHPRLLISSLLATAAALSLISGAPAMAHAKSPAASATLTVCTTGPAAPARMLEVEGQMRAGAGASRTQMRFALQTQAAPRTRWRRVKGEGLDTWRTADPAPSRFAYAKGVDGLIAGARYRMVVSFAWIDASGHRLASTRRTSRVCKQPDLRPKLVLRGLRVRPGPTPSTRRYVLTVSNRGRSAAPTFATGLVVDGRRLAAQTLAGLAAGASAELAWSGPGCAAPSVVVAEADLEGLVDQRDETNDVLTVSCPAAAPARGLD